MFATTNPLIYEEGDMVLQWVLRNKNGVLL